MSFRVSRLHAKIRLVIILSIALLTLALVIGALAEKRPVEPDGFESRTDQSSALSTASLVTQGTQGGTPSCTAFELDPTFGVGGRVVTSFPGGLDTASDVAVQTDGKVVVAGSSGSDFALARYNTDGTLDPTFGSGGRVNTDFPTGMGGSGNGLVIQPDGKIVVAGSATDPVETTSSAFALVRYNTNGTLDTSFDGDGRVVTSFTDSSAVAEDIAQQADGKLVLAGTGTDSATGVTTFALARYNTDGSPDNSFDGDGRVTTDIPGLNFERANAVAVQADGRVVAAGQGNGTFVLTRYNINGSLDTGAAGDSTPGDSFGTGGIATTDFGGSFEDARALAIQTDGKIIAAGQTALSTAANDNFAIARYNTDGSPDNTFDTDGKVITDFGFVDAANAVVIQTDGKIVAAGSAGTIPTGSNFALARYNTNGSLDGTFDGDGRQTTDFSGGRFGLGAQGVALQTDGRIVAAGDANISGQRDFGVARYGGDGLLDTVGFGTLGKVITDFPLNEETITGMVVQPDGKIVAAGRFNFAVRISRTQDLNFQLARYNMDGTLDQTFGTGGLVSTGFGVDTDDLAQALALQSDGKIVVVGQSGPHLSQSGIADTAFAVARYNPDGSLDNTFDGDGRVTTEFGATPDTAFAVAIQTNGMIVVVGENGSDFALARYNTNGTLDTNSDADPSVAFDTDGKVTTNFVDNSDSASAVVIQSDGKIVAGGSAGGSFINDTTDDFGLARYNTDGSLDMGFGTGGKVTTDFFLAFDGMNGLVIQPNGKLVAAGFATITGSNNEFAFARYNTNGTLDTNSDADPAVSFDTDGKQTTDFTGFDPAADLALHADGRIVAAGLNLPLIVNNRPAAFFALAQYNADGSVDNGFGPGGKITTDFFGINNQGTAVVVQSDGKVVAGGFADTGSSNDFALARYRCVGAQTPNTVQFSASNYNVGEAVGSAQIIVTRSDTSTAATVDYATSDGAGLNECDFFNGIGSSRCDYATSIGRLNFAAGEGSKNIFVPLVDDSYAEGNEILNITLSNASGTTLGSPASATITIQDNETVNGSNPIDGVDFFIRQQYIDFLGREPDPAGLEGWRNVLNNCGITVAPPCDRIEVSAGFFRSEEFQTRGYFIYRFFSAVGKIPLSEDFYPDFAKVSGFLTAEQLEANKAAYVNEVMARADFQTKYASTFSNPTAYVDALLQTVGLPNHPSRQTWINQLNATNNTQTRGQVLRQLVESGEVFNKYFNEAFVLMQYFGYLRRTADASYLSWIQTMNDTGGDYRIMINGFMNSVEYRKRFGP